MPLKNRVNWEKLMLGVRKRWEGGGVYLSESQWGGGGGGGGVRKV